MTTTATALTSMAVTSTEARSSRGVVAAGHGLEVAAGLAMLEAGGNAVDAVVAAAFTGYVVEPAMCGLGGYGRLSAYLARPKRLVSVDHYVRAPGAARAGMFEIDESRGLKYYETPYTKGLKAERGALAAGVPGAVAGLYWTQRRFGRLSWAAVLEPAIAAATAGLDVTWPLILRLAENHAAILAMPDLAAHFLPGGALPRAAGTHAPGDVLDRSGLASVLKRIQAEGAAGFYTGPTAARIAAAVRAGDGILSEADLASYRPRILDEPVRRYRGLDYVTSFDPVGCEALNILDRFDLAKLGADSAEFHHVMAEAMAVAFVDNIQHYGDPDFVPESPVAALASPELGARRAAMLRLDRALERPVAALSRAELAALTGDRNDAAIGRREETAPWPPKLGGTSQMVAADNEGNMVALLTSISGSFGSFVAVGDSGIILNNGMGNFDPRPGRPNDIAPGKMPIFAVPELIAVEGRGGPRERAVFAAAGSGGYRITTAVLHALIHWHDFGMGLEAAIEAPRVHCQGKETFVPSRLGAAVHERLSALGHRIVVQDDSPGLNAYGRVSAVAIGRDGTEALEAASGPPWLGAAGGL